MWLVGQILTHCAWLQSAVTRAKAVKALGTVLQASQQLLQMVEVQMSISNSLRVRYRTSI